MILPSPLEIAAIATSFIVSAGLAFYFLKSIQAALYLGAAGAILYFAASVAYGYEQKGVAQEKVHTDAARQELADYQQKQREYVARVILGFEKAADDTEHAQKEKDVQRDKDFAAIKARAAALARRNDPVPAPVVGVLRDAAKAAEPTGPAAEPESSAETATPVSVGQVTDWGISVLEWARECADRVTGWETYYKKLRDNENSATE